MKKCKEDEGMLCVDVEGPATCLVACAKKDILAGSCLAQSSSKVIVHERFLLLFLS
jgi:hypothetical protein